MSRKPPPPAGGRRRRPLSEDPEFRRYAADMENRVVPRLEESGAYVAMLGPSNGPERVQFWTELGAAIMLGKPLILSVVPGTEVPAALARAADEIVEVDWQHPAGAEDLSVRLQAAMRRLVPDEGEG